MLQQLIALEERLYEVNDGVNRILMREAQNKELRILITNALQKYYQSWDEANCQAMLDLLKKGRELPREDRKDVYLLATKKIDNPKYRVALGSEAQDMGDEEVYTALLARFLGSYYRHDYDFDCKAVVDVYKQTNRVPREAQQRLANLALSKVGCNICKVAIVEEASERIKNMQMTASIIEDEKEESELDLLLHTLDPATKETQDFKFLYDILAEQYQVRETNPKRCEEIIALVKRGRKFPAPLRTALYRVGAERLWNVNYEVQLAKIARNTGDVVVYRTLIGDFTDNDARQEFCKGVVDIFRYSTNVVKDKRVELAQQALQKMKHDASIVDLVKEAGGLNNEEIYQTAMQQVSSARARETILNIREGRYVRRAWNTIKWKLEDMITD